LATSDVGIDDENQFSPLRAKAFAATALAGLNDDGAALRGTRHGERATRAKKPAVVIKAVHLLRAGEQTARLVLDDRVVLPAVPLPEHHFHELVGPIVAQVVLDHLLAAHVLSLAIVERGDDVPGRAALSHQVERGEQACHMERLVVAGGIRRTQAEPLGGHAHDREHRHCIHFHAADAMAHRMGVVVPIDIGHRQPVVEEPEVEFTFLEYPADVPIVVRRPGIGARLRVPPGARKIGTILCLQEGDQGHLAHRKTYRNVRRATFVPTWEAWQLLARARFSSLRNEEGELAFASYRIEARVAKRLTHALYLRWC
jgi:hypothetical protein